MTTQYKDTCLHEAVRFNDIDEARTALRAGYDPNQIGLYQWSPLHEAANNGDIHIVKLLLRFKGDPNLRDILQGCTAVHYASKGDHYECLQLLLSAGGRYDIINNHGESCLDVACGESVQLLQQQRKQEIISTSPPQCELSLSPPPKPQFIRETTLVADSGSENVSPQLSRGPSSYSEESDLFDVNSIDSSPACSEINFRRTWSITSQIKKRELALGHIELSFEYNSKKGTLKIRVWQVHGLIMPPADQSMVSGIYVKSYLLPEDKKDTKRRTEELSVYKSEKADGKKLSSAKRRDSSNLITRGSGDSFNPLSFNFEKALEYKNISKEIIAKKDIEIHVAITQRYSRRSFVIATWNMPLKIATRKLVREKFQMKAVLGGNIPDNMRVYGANELSGRGQIRNAYSNPNIRCPSVSSLALSEGNERASSDIDLKQVVLHTPEQPESCILSLQEEDDGVIVDELEQISVSVQKEATHTKVNIPNTEQHIIPEVKILNVPKSRRNSGRSRYSSTESESDVDRPTSKRSSKKSTKDSSHVEMGKTSKTPKGHKPEMATFSSLNEESPHSQKKSKKSRDQQKMFDSRPSTPEWDYFMEPLSITMVSPELMDDDFDLCLLEPNEPVLPIMTSLSPPGEQQRYQSADVNQNNPDVESLKKASQREKNTFDDDIGFTVQDAKIRSKHINLSKNKRPIPVTEL